MALEEEVKRLGDRIDFPYNNERYLEKAKKCIQENSYEQARSYVEKAYKTKRTYATNRFYTSILFNLEQYKEALTIANEYKNIYAKNESHLLMYAMLLIKNQQFLEAERLIQKHQRHSFSAFVQEWRNLKQKLDLERELFNLEIEQKRQKIKYQLLNISHFSLFEQMKLMEDARSLLVEDLQAVAPQIFNDPSIANQLQKAFLEVLIEKGDTNCYTFSWFNQFRRICPQELLVFEQVPITQEVETALKEKLYKSPHLYDIIQLELLSDLLLLYPFIDEVITDVSYWVDLYVVWFTDSQKIKNEPTNSKQAQMSGWMHRLNQIAQRN